MRRWIPSKAGALGRLQPTRACAAAMQYLDDSVTELQRIHELHKRGQQEPVVLQKAMPVLTLLLQLRGQRRVQATESGCKYLHSEKQVETVLSEVLDLYRTAHKDAYATGPKTKLRVAIEESWQLARMVSSCSVDRIRKLCPSRQQGKTRAT